MAGHASTRSLCSDSHGRPQYPIGAVAARMYHGACTGAFRVVGEPPRLRQAFGDGRTFVLDGYLSQGSANTYGALPRVAPYSSGAKPRRNAYCRACYAACSRSPWGAPSARGAHRVLPPNATPPGCRQTAPSVPALSPLGRVGAIRGRSTRPLHRAVASVCVPPNRAAAAPLVRALRTPGGPVCRVHRSDVTRWPFPCTCRRHGNARVQ